MMTCSRLLRTSLPLLLALGYLRPVEAAPIGTFDLQPDVSSVIAGGSFNVTVFFNTNGDDLEAISYHLTDLTMPNFGGFAISGADFSASVFDPDSTTDESVIISSGQLNRTNGADLGGLAPENNPAGPGILNLGSFTISTAGVAAGTYTLGIANDSLLGAINSDFEEYGFNLSSASFDIHIDAAAVPEPGSCLLCGMVAVGAAVLRRRQKRISARSPGGDVSES